MKIPLFAIAGAGVLFAATSAVAQDAEHTLSEFKLGEHISGDKVDLSAQEGRVVVIEYWGTR
ncbi:MAG: hypothetical protein P8J87_17000 [Verrucomicrobiales bacterium]|nr:hypothetical protein [Verrucomicrobiales bacterium]